jgi:hypothetical protein
MAEGGVLGGYNSVGPSVGSQEGSRDGSIEASVEGRSTDDAARTAASVTNKSPKSGGDATLNELFIPKEMKRSRVAHMAYSNSIWGTGLEADMNNIKI